MGCQKNRRWPRFRSSARRRSASSAATRRQSSASAPEAQLASLQQSGVIHREFADTYRMTAVPRTGEQRLRYALAWAGAGSSHHGRSAGELYGFEGVQATRPEIVVPDARGVRSTQVVIHRVTDHRGSDVAPAARATDNRCRGHTARARSRARRRTVRDRVRRRPPPSAGVDSFLRAYPRPMGPGRPAGSHGTTPTPPSARSNPHGAAVDVGGEDPAAVRRARSRQLLREFPLAWRGRTFRFDLAFPRQRTILETNGRRWHDDATDYEYDNEKWSVPGRHGYRIVLATWAKVTERPADLIAELETTLVPERGVTLVTSPRAVRDRSGSEVDV